MAEPTPAVNNQNSEQADASEGRRNTWIVTLYGIFALCVLALIAYSVAQYAVQ